MRVDLSKGRHRYVFTKYGARAAKSGVADLVTLPNDVRAGSTLRGVRVLMVGNDLEYFRMHRLALALALARDGVDLHVAIPYSKSDARLLGDEFEVHRLDLRRVGLNPFLEAKTLAQLATLSKQLKPALVHHITIKPILYGSLIARVLNTPAIVNSTTGLGYIFASDRPTPRILRKIIVPCLRRGCDRPNVIMLFENEDDRALYCSLGITDDERGYVIPSSGIDPNDFIPRVHQAGPVKIVLVARMLWDKGIREFVDAARSVLRTHPETRFVLVGSCDLNPESIPEHVLRGWEAEGIVEYCGWRSDIAQVLADADVLCLPSYREGLPRALLEGGAAGLALVATDVPGCRDVVVDGLTGLIVPPRNASALARAILALVEDSDRRKAMGEAARADVTARFGIASVIEKTRRAYSQALIRRG